MRQIFSGEDPRRRRDRDPYGRQGAPGVAHPHVHLGEVQVVAHAVRPFLDELRELGGGLVELLHDGMLQAEHRQPPLVRKPLDVCGRLLELLLSFGMPAEIEEGNAEHHVRLGERGIGLDREPGVRGRFLVLALLELRTGDDELVNRFKRWAKPALRCFLGIRRRIIQGRSKRDGEAPGGGRHQLFGLGRLTQGRHARAAQRVRHD